MTTIALILTLLFSACSEESSSNTEPQDFTSLHALLTHWKANYSDSIPDGFTFVQTTVKFKDGIPNDTSTWYEAIQYPKNFRIDFGQKLDGNRNLYRQDSIYALRKGEIVHKADEIQQFLLIEGGIYFEDIDTILKKLQTVGVNTSLFRKDIYMGHEVYIIGAEKDDLSTPQIWLDPRYRSAVKRIMQLPGGQLLDVRYETYEKVDGYWTETYLEFYMDGQLFQTEQYHNVQMNPDLPDGIFHPKKFKTTYWY